MKPTPITENEEFKAGMEETYSTEGLPIKQMAEIIGRKIDYQLGAKAAQSILQKEHEEEKAALVKYLMIYGFAEGPWFKTLEAFQLFRERDGK